MTKRLLDIFGSLCGLILFSPLMAAIAIWIKLDSKGPLFFRQERIGRFGRPFFIHKFRTMVVDAETRGLQLTTGEDSRITRSGHFLRKYKLDELAQLIDVLKGDMSIVGPRPEVPKYVAHYPADLKEIALSVKPGITDFASIEYRDENEILSKATDPEKAYIELILPAKLKYHRKYALNQSSLVDLQLIFKTAALVFGRWMPDALNLLGKLSRNEKRLIVASFDALALPLAFWSALVLIEETFTPRVGDILWMFPLIPFLSIPIFIHLGLYRAVIRYMEDKTVFTIFYGVSLSVTLLLIVVVVAQQLPLMHKSSFVIYWLIAMVYIGGSRMLARSYYRKTKHRNEHKKSVIIYGAGDAGVQLAIGLQAAGRCTPIAFVDDDPKLQSHEIGGLQVYSPDELPELINYMHVDQVLLAIPSATSQRRAEILASLRKLHPHVFAIPGIGEITSRMTPMSKTSPQKLQHQE